MVTIRFISAQTGAAPRVHDVQARAGQTLMQVAVGAGLDAIAADCGGTLSCATCHVYVAPEWMARLPEPTDEERGMLEFTAAVRRDGSRLSCQITVAPALDGLTVELPDRQY